MIRDSIGKCGIIPVIALEDAADAVPLCKALEAGGLNVAEVTFRTKAARDPWFLWLVLLQALNRHARAEVN